MDDKDTIYRQAAIDALDNQIKQCDKALGSFDISMRDEFAVKAERASLTAFKEQLEYLPSVQPEPAIPLQWIETEIEWLKSLDNAFSTLTAGQISAMVNKWKDEQDG